MKLLIIGGTIFLGRHLVEAAAGAGHDVSIFHRGRHNAAKVPAAEVLIGDRDGDLSPLRQRRWDAAIDTCGYTPQSVGRVVGLLRESADHYTFVSSVSAYERFEAAGTEESAPLATISSEYVREAEAISSGARGDRPTAMTYGEWYGALKALCEQEAERRMPGRALNVRPGLIVGPHDYTDRFTYWVRRVARGGEILAPGRPERRVRVIDVRDLAAWIIRMVERRQTGIYNATGPEERVGMGSMLETMRDVSGADANFVWAPEPFLEQREVQAWSELPLWIPEDRNGIFEVANRKAVAQGLTFRSLSETIRQTLEWDRSRGDAPMKAGLSPERERMLLENLKKVDS